LVDNKKKFETTERERERERERESGKNGGWRSIGYNIRK
jgi:hypothetical protein